MKTIWVGNSGLSSLKSAFRSFCYFLLADLVPVFLLLAVMAFGMALVSSKLSEPRSVELAVLADEQS